ncbi:MAG: amidohydrolase [Oscillospiraceae bacterium]|nr:amidohydrolase [Oscillospiraceae bacterium]
MIRFYNGRVLTLADGSLELGRDEVWTDGAKICYVGAPRAEMPRFEREINLRGDLLMPGFKDAHTHSAMTFARSLADDLPLQDWLYTKIFPLEEKLTPERVYWLNKLAVMEYLTSGITASFDMYYHRDAYAQSNIDCGFRTVICGVGGTAQAMDDEYVRFNSLHPLVSYIPGFHAEYTATVDDMRAVAEVARAHRAPVFAHNSETERETAECRERHGMTPTELMDSLGLFDYGGGGFHCVWLSAHDREIFRSRGLWAVMNPCSNAKLASGVAPLVDYMSDGINLALGTDGPSSNNALDFFREMYLSAVLQKLRARDAAACDCGGIIKMATLGGAGAMGLGDCDTLAAGKQADMTVINLRRPNMQPLNNIVKNIVYSGSKENVRLTMVAGRVLYEDGEFYIGEDAESVYARCQKITEEMLAD